MSDLDAEEFCPNELASCSVCGSLLRRSVLEYHEAACKARKQRAELPKEPYFYVKNEKSSSPKNSRSSTPMGAVGAGSKVSTSNSNVFDSEEEFLVCPFEELHKVRRSKFRDHVKKCEQAHPENDFVFCKYNSRELVHVRDYEEHLIQCAKKHESQRYVQ